MRGRRAPPEAPASPHSCAAEYSISAAAIAIFSLGFIIVGTLCALLSFRKKRDYLLRPAAMFYIFAGRMGLPPLSPARQGRGWVWTRPGSAPLLPTPRDPAPPPPDPRPHLPPWSSRTPAAPAPGLPLKARSLSPAVPAGLCLSVSAEVLRQSVRRMVESEHTAWIAHSFAWSFVCACVAAALLLVGGLALLLLALPRMPRDPWESCMDAEPEH